MDVGRLQTDVRRVRELLVRYHVILATEHQRILYEILRIEERVDAWRREEESFVQGVLDGISQREAFQLDRESDELIPNN